MKTDSELQQDVMEELKWEPILQASEIGVAVTNGVVTLNGHVSNFRKKQAAENAAKRVKDVKAVAIDIEVKPIFGEEKSDTSIANAALKALEWDSLVPDDKIKIEVDNGWVRLEGNVDWYYQKNAAEDAVKSLAGVKGISNLITIQPWLKTTVVKDKIKKALERSADIEFQRINVETQGSTIVLKGKVRTWSEKGEVVRAAWSTPGVTEVKDKLVVAA